MVRTIEERLAQLVNKWEMRQHSIAMGFWALTNEEESTVAELFEYRNIKDDDNAAEIADDILSLIEFNTYPFTQACNTVSDVNDIYEYAVCLFNHPTGKSVKVGWRDVKTMQVLYSEQIGINNIYTGCMNYAKHLSDSSDSQLCYIMLEGFWATLISIIQKTI